MGSRKGPYNADFPQGSEVRVASRADLERFLVEWRLHNPLTPDQLAFAGRTARVMRVGYYHGGDELYWLDGIPGVWHLQCLRSVEPDDGV